MYLLIVLVELCFFYYREKNLTKFTKRNKFIKEDLFKYYFSKSSNLQYVEKK